MQLSEKQKKHLRALAHDLKPLIHVGNHGVSAAVTKELDQTLAHHELVKVKIHESDREARATAIDALVESTSSALVSRIGNVAILYRRRTDDPGIILP